MAITLSYTFAANTRILSAEVNSNFSTLATRALDKTGDTMTGSLLFTDATYDIGASGATRPRDLFLSRNATIGGTLGVTGVITATAGQIVFPATQSAAAGVNTLDDYEEGTWTPVIGGDGGTSGQSYSIQTGRYVKIGRFVHAYCNVVLSAKGTITGNVEIQGFPFTSENTANLSPALKITYWNNLATSFVALGGFMSNNVTAAGVRGATAAATALTQLTTTDIGNTSQFVCDIFYSATA